MGAAVCSQVPRHEIHGVVVVAATHPGGRVGPGDGVAHLVSRHHGEGEGITHERPPSVVRERGPVVAGSCQTPRPRAGEEDTVGVAAGVGGGGVVALLLASRCGRLGHEVQLVGASRMSGEIRHDLAVQLCHDRVHRHIQVAGPHVDDVLAQAVRSQKVDAGQQPQGVVRLQGQALESGWVGRQIPSLPGLFPVDCRRWALGLSRRRDEWHNQQHGRQRQSQRVLLHALSSAYVVGQPLLREHPTATPI